MSETILVYFWKLHNMHRSSRDAYEIGGTKWFGLVGTQIEDNQKS